MGAVKNAIKRLANRFGYEVRKKSRQDINQLSSFELCLSLLLSQNEKLNIIQIGANDGIAADPLHEFLKQFPKVVNIILIEPQEQLIPYLEENTRFLPNKYIINAAVGPEESLTLYRVAQDAWGDLDVPYAKARGWQPYNAPTGITSAHKDHVERWLRRYYKGGKPLSDIIEAVTVESIDINTALIRANMFEQPDILQIDVEGFDDEIIYLANLAELRPKIINFEFTNLTAGKPERLLRHLDEVGYIVSQEGNDALAILTHPV